MDKKNNNIKTLIVMQIAVLFFSLSGVMGKNASQYEFMSFGFILFYGLEILILGIYAIVWQQVIKKIDISVAYVNKATTIFWSMIFAFIIFNEKITIQNIIGVIIIFIGVLVVNRND